MAMIKLTPEQEQFLENSCTKIKQEDQRQFYYMPFWWEKLGDGTWTVHNFDNLPPDLKQALRLMREHSFKPIKPKPHE
jgi:hypothetical protein